MTLTLSDLCGIWGDPIGPYPLNLNDPIAPVCIDSRNFTNGGFFVPLKGPKYDGHNFLYEVTSLGAQASVISRDCSFPIPEDLTYWIVEDTLYAFQQLALLHRRKLSIPVVAVTGSVGKTTTKEMIKASLLSLGSITSSLSNNNNDIGVPLTLLKANESTAALVVEMGMRGLGQIKKLSRCANPDIAIITNIGSAHLGMLGSRENIAKAKCEITSFLKPDGVVIVPEGDPLLEKFLKLNWQGRIIRVSLKDSSKNEFYVDKSIENNILPSSDIIGELVNNNRTLSVNGIQYNLPLEGIHNAFNFLFAIAVSRELNIPNQRLSDLTVHMPEGRNRSMAIGKITLLDETYNSSPESVIAALNLLVNKPGRHFVVLGRMLELGDESISLHCLIAQKVIQLGLDGLVIVGEGPESYEMAKVAKNLKNLQVVKSPEEALLPLKSWIKEGDFLLLKASRAIALERLIPLLYKEFVS